MKGFLRAGHTPTLVAALLYFDVSFMAWVLLGPLAPFPALGAGTHSDRAGADHGHPASGRFVVSTAARHARRTHWWKAHGTARADVDARHVGCRLAARPHDGSLLRARVLPRDRGRQPC